MDPSDITPELVAQWQQVLLDDGAYLGDAGLDDDGADGHFGRLTLAAGVDRVESLEQARRDLGLARTEIAELKARIAELEAGS